MTLPPREPLSATRVAFVQAKSIAHSAARAVLKGVRRDRARVMQEYDQGTWAKRRAERTWERAASLEEFLVGSRTDPLFAKVEGQPVRIACRDYYRYRLDALARLAAEHLPTQDELVELGSGFGYNIFALALAFPQRHFIGLDISPNGVDTARMIAAHFGLASRVRFDFLDLAAADAPNFGLLHGRSCFTFFCLEQLPHAIPAALASIARARPNRVLHTESSSELLDLRRPGDWANYAFVKSMDYQASLFGTLQRMQARGEARLLHIGRAPFAPTLQNDGFIAAWEPRP